MENAATQNSSRNDNDTIILGIESTAHTFGVGIVSSSKPFILADIRKRYTPEKGGILPREVAQYFSTVASDAIHEAFTISGLSPRDLNAVAVALGPGMGPALRVGATVARALSSHLKIPLIAVNHAIAHIEIARFLTGLKDPIILYVSGGNTTVTAYNHGAYRVFGETLDIALGNLQDTFAREVGLAPPYIRNGRHVIDHCADKGSFLEDLPYVVKGQDVSFSGLLTAAIRKYEKSPKLLPDICYTLREIAYSSVVEVTERGLAHLGKKQVIVTGGVAASDFLNEKVEIMAKSHNAGFIRIPKKYAGDNGVMIALTGLLMYRHGIGFMEPSKAFIKQRWRLDKVPVPWYPDTLG